MAALAIRWRWQQAMGPRPAAESIDLDPYRLAMINGGSDLAITAAAAHLQKRGALAEGDGDSQLVVGGPLDPDADDLERAVYAAVQDEPHIDSYALRRELADSEPVERLQSRLTDVGLLLKADVVTALRRLWFVGLALIVLGIARIWAGVLNDANILYLTLMVVAVAAATFWFGRLKPWATARGQALLSRQRERRSDLSSGGNGSELPLAVALWGGAALWAAEPAIASTWNIPRESTAGYGGGSYGSGGCGGSWGHGAGCGSSSGCGGSGGGCGGGCGGGGS